jgi:hypothetical protein
MRRLGLSKKERGGEATYESDNLCEAPEGEEDFEQHNCGCRGATPLDGIVLGCRVGSEEVVILARTMGGAVDSAGRSESNVQAEAASFSSC